MCRNTSRLHTMSFHNSAGVTLLLPLSTLKANFCIEVTPSRHRGMRVRVRRREPQFTEPTYLYNIFNCAERTE